MMNIDSNTTVLKHYIFRMQEVKWIETFSSEQLERIVLMKVRIIDALQYAHAVFFYGP
jgi:hypothetical protein